MTNKIFDFINLNNGEEKKGKVFENVVSNISFRGSNLWILACAIVIASIGLNVNSTAVVIGAMLISPLMGPIVGAGFSLAIYDFNLLERSLKNLLIATLVGLVVATVYFAISPFKETHSEILSRTSPNIYDVLIAFFGGLVGVIALTRVEKGNPIPGVAIATALMPPLCTAGYGLAIGNYSYFFGAFYLYTINCFFICIATFFIIKLLKYPPVKILNPKFETQIKYGISTLVMVLIIPSFYLAYDLLQEKKYSQKVEQFITNEFTNNGCTLIYKHIKFNTDPKTIEVALLNKRYNEDDIELLNKKLAIYDIKNTRLKVIQDTKDIKGEILTELGNHSSIMTEKDILINNLKKELDEYKLDNSEILKELAILFPELLDVSLGRHAIYANTDTTKAITVLLYRSHKKIPQGELTKIESWINLKMKTKDSKLVKEK